jgi:catechol 2,3-dioxygenase-like lactoylglutathione lyase family enzyme
VSSTETSTGTPEVGTIDRKLEVVTLPVSDVDRAQRFYERLAWRMDGDLALSDAAFSDPDGNGWLLQGTTTRLPGREWDD